MFVLKYCLSFYRPTLMKPLIAGSKAQRGSTEPETSCLTCRVGSGGWVCLASMWGCISRTDGSSRSVHVGLLLELTNVFLVSDSFIPKPVGNLSEKKKKQNAVLFSRKLRSLKHNGCALLTWALMVWVTLRRATVSSRASQAAAVNLH